MNEIVNNPNRKDMIDIDLLIDYSKVIYSELTELKLNKLNNHEFSETAKAVKLEKSKPGAEPSSAKSTPAPEVGLSKPQNIYQETKEQETEVHSKPRPAPELESIGINFEGPTEFVNIPKQNAVFEDLRKLIPLNDKFAYVIELFNGENNSYEDAINTLNQQTTYGNSMEWIIANLQNKYNWNVENDLVQNFYETIKNRFIKKS